MKILRATGEAMHLTATAAVETQLEVALLRDGGVIPSILQKTIGAHGPREATATALA